MAKVRLSPLAEQLWEELRWLGPDTGMEAWLQIARRIAIAERNKGEAPDIGRVRVIGRDAEGRPLISRSDLDAALVECERAGCLRCASTERSGADEVYTWAPLPVEAPAKRQATLFK